MERVVSSVRITENAHHLLAQLVEKLGQPKAQVIEEALRVFEERLFWDAVQRSFAEGETEEIRAERELWDSTSADGAAEERW